MTEAQRPLRVFLCHAHSDKDAVKFLYIRLTKDGVDAWLDKAKLLPGQDWELEIRKAVRGADVVVVCLSKQFNQAGFRQKEVRLALDTAMEQPEGEIFIIPARLEECDTLESLRKWHWVDLFENDGYEMLMRALQARADKIGKTEKLAPSMRVMVTGGREISGSIGKVAFLIGSQVIARGHILISNGSIGVDRFSAEGALDVCKKKSLSPKNLIQIYRPVENPNPEFEFGNKHIVGETYGQRRDFVVDTSDAVILLGGGRGTLKVANRALRVRKPLIPIGVGEPTSAAYDLWHKMLTGDIDSPIGIDDLRKIGDEQNKETLATNALILAEKLTRR